MKKIVAAMVIIITLSGCEDSSARYEKGEYITRKSGDKVEIPPPVTQSPPRYPWDS